MASFEWKKLNSDILLEDTRKKLYQKYFCSAKYFCPGGRIIQRPENDTVEKIYEAIEFRKQYQRTYNYGGSWRYFREKADQIDVTQLLDFSRLKEQYEETVKIRVEEPHLTLYSESEAELYQIVTTELAAWHDRLVTVHRPSNDKIVEMLNSNAIIVKTDLGYKYKFICKDGSCPNKQAVYSYLDHLGDQVRVSKTVWTTLERPGSYMWGVWFYCNDPSIANMLNIIEPNFITNIHEVVVG